MWGQAQVHATCLQLLHGRQASQEAAGCRHGG
jgi:hypothetical protein